MANIDITLLSNEKFEYSETGEEVPTYEAYYYKINMDQKVMVKKLSPDAILPKYAKPGDAGFDLHACETVTIHPHQTTIVPTGLAFAIPEGFEMQVRMRSGAALKTPLILHNAPGTIDSGYRGEIGLILHNLSDNPYTVEKGERLCQGIIAPVVSAWFEEVDTLPESERGANGYGSTGTK